MSKETKTLPQKLHAVMKSIDRIGKDKQNDFQKYSYASEKAIKERLHKELVKHGVLFRMDILNSDITTLTSKDKTQILTTISTKYYFTDVETGKQIEGTFEGSGLDSGDKGLYKAITGAIKYILTTTFLIPTGDDPENQKEKDVTTYQLNTSSKTTDAKCAKCGAGMRISKNSGRPYCSALCWKNPAPEPEQEVTMDDIPPF